MTAAEGLFALIESWSGICLERGGAGESLQRFLHGRTRELGLPSIDAYLTLLDGPLRAERDRLLDAVTVNYTWFYRDGEQLDDVVKLLRDGWPGGAALNVWVPGCATGEDAYSMAMLARLAGREAYVLGTDVNSASVAFAKEARYGSWAMRELPADLWRFFAPSGKGAHRVVDELRERVVFERHNLVEPPRQAPGGGWDLILCRNVLIYFSRARADETHERLGASLAPGGWLLIGASEAVYQEPAGLRLARLGGRAALFRPGQGADAVPGWEAPALRAALFLGGVEGRRARAGAKARRGALTTARSFRPGRARRARRIGPTADRAELDSG